MGRVKGQPTAERELTHGAVDVYVHASPDLIERHWDDFGLVRSLVASGYRAAVHRHHFSSTAERSVLVQHATGFPLLGALLLNEPAGGFSPAVVEYALKNGAAWVGLPTSSARHFLNRTGASPYLPSPSGSECGTVLDEDGRLRSVVHEILHLVREHDAILNLGYLAFEECLAVCQAAEATGVERLVLTSPEFAVGFSRAEIIELLEFPELWVEVTAFTMHPTYILGDGAASSEQRIQQAGSLIAAVGVDRCVLSSDGGIKVAPEPGELLEWSARQLIRLGFSEAQIRMLAVENPTALLGDHLEHALALVTPTDR
ncbi:MAG: DUF6282 family protein [Actinomycetota bacterium]